MNKTKWFTIVKGILRSLLVIALTVAIFSVSGYLFKYNLFGEQYFLPNATLFIPPILILLIFNSLVLAVHSQNKDVRAKYLESEDSGSFSAAAKFILKSTEFYIEIAIIVFLPIFNVWLLPLMIALNFGARMIILRNWYKDRKRPENIDGGKIPSSIKRVFFVVLVYCSVSMIAAWFMPLIATLMNIADGIGFIKIILFIFIAVLVVFIFVYIRALLKRKSFITKLQKYCKTNQVPISEIKKTYLSVFFWHPGSDFTIEKNGKKFECKLIAGVFPGAQTVFSDNGKGHHRHIFSIFKFKIFELRTDFVFAFDSDVKKVLILSPTPKKIYASIQGSPARPADTGEKIGEYTVYNATGFLGALDRDCL